MHTDFTPAHALAGGALIGASVLLLLLALGRSAGVSGILASALSPSIAIGERAWRLAFLAGLVGGPVLAMAVLREPLIRPSPASAPALLVAGLVSGLGAGLARGCTSGHGVCGMSRLSARSIAATVLFMACGMLMASVLRQLIRF